MFKLGEYLLFTVMTSLLLGLLLTGYIAYLAVKKLDEFESHLKNSALVNYNRRMMGNSLVGRMYRMLQIVSLLGMRGFFIKKGQLDAEDSENFPEHLSGKVVWPGRLMLILFVIMIVGGGYGKYFNGYNL